MDFGYFGDYAWLGRVAGAGRYFNEVVGWQGGNVGKVVGFQGVESGCYGRGAGDNSEGACFR